MKIILICLVIYIKCCYVKDSEGNNYDLSFLKRRKDWEVFKL